MRRTTLSCGSSYPDTRTYTETASPPKKQRKRTLLDIAALHARNEPIAMITAHDYPSACFVEANADQIDICLVGDSLAMVACGYASTNELSLDELLYHCRAVKRGTTTPLLVGDLTFGSYQQGVDHAVGNALRLIQEGGMEAVKLEGGTVMAPVIKRMVDVGIPVMGHVGLTPQHQVAFSGFRVQGKTAASALKIYKDALAVQNAGAFSMILEAMPTPVAAYITKKLRIPTISIGAGSGCSGQVLVLLDMLGGFDRFVPRFTKQYMDLSTAARSAVREYATEVKDRSFPQEGKHTYAITDKELEEFEKAADALQVDDLP